MKPDQYVFGTWRSIKPEALVTLSLQPRGLAQLKINNETYPIMGWLFKDSTYWIGEYFVVEASEHILILGQWKDGRQTDTRYQLKRVLSISRL